MKPNPNCQYCLGEGVRHNDYYEYPCSCVNDGILNMVMRGEAIDGSELNNKLKAYYVLLSVIGEGRLHVVMAKDENHVKEQLNNFWFGKDLKYHEIRELDEPEVVLTKHLEHE